MGIRLDPLTHFYKGKEVTLKLWRFEDHVSVISLPCWHWIIWVTLCYGTPDTSDCLDVAQLAMVCVLCLSPVSGAVLCSRHTSTWKRERGVSGLVNSVRQPRFIRALSMEVTGPRFP